MIAREWRCLCPQENADGFLGHLRATGVAEARALPGCRGHQILRQPAEPGSVEFTLLTYWDSLADAWNFAGVDSREEACRAVLYPGDEVYGIVPDETVRHYEVLEAELE